MFCSHCGTDMPDDSRFCRKCGAALGSAVAAAPTGFSTGAAPAPAVERPSIYDEKPSHVGRWILTALLIIVIGWAVLSITTLRPSAARERDQLQRQFAQPTVRHMTTNIAGTPFVIAPGQYVYYQLVVPPRCFNVVLNGHFAAAGGGGNDVEVVLLDNDGFVNWRNGHQTPTFYNSGKVTQSTVDVQLPNDAKTYYLVFSNTFSLVSNKAITAGLTLQYDQPQ